MILDNMLPVVGQLLQRRYHDAYRARLERVAREQPELRITPWPDRRSRKRKPYPGVLNVVDETEG